jgi:polysaccharide export outer membrane protein
MLVGLACAAPPTSPRQPSAAPEYHVAPPDVLAITIRPEPALARKVTVRPDGYVSLDLIGDVYVEGKTVSEIRQAITDRITDYIVRPDVAVDLVQSNSRKFFMFGQVRRSGVFPLIGRVTASHALAHAGGATVLSAPDRAHLVRVTPTGGATTYTIRFDDIVKRGDMTTDYELQPGDLIYVPPGYPAQIGFAIQWIFYPIQAILGLGGRFIPRPSAY